MRLFTLGLLVCGMLAAVTNIYAEGPRLNLKDRRAMTDFKSAELKKFEKDVEAAAKKSIPITLHDNAFEPDMSHMYKENLPKVYFEPVLEALARISKEYGAESLNGINKIELKNESGKFRPEEAVSFSGGVLTIDHGPNSNVDYVDGRTAAVVRALEAGL